MRMSHGHYPCSEKTHESPTNAPETEQQERDHETPGRHGRPVHYEVAWIAGDEAHQEGNQVEDGACKSACQEAEPSTDGNSANDPRDAQRDFSKGAEKPRGISVESRSFCEILMKC